MLSAAFMHGSGPIRKTSVAANSGQDKFFERRLFLGLRSVERETARMNQTIARGVSSTGNTISNGQKQSCLVPGKGRGPKATGSGL